MNIKNIATAVRGFATILLISIGIGSMVPANCKYVYKTPRGKRYHYKIRCAGRNSRKITLKKAKYFRLTPCKKCVCRVRKHK